MKALEKVQQFIQDYQMKIQGLNERIQSCEDRINYLQLEIRFLNENEIPEAQTKVVLEGTDSSHVTKLKKQLQKYQDELQMKQEELVILQNSVSQFKYKVGEEAVKLEKLFKEEKMIQEKKKYAKMMYYKKMYIDSLIEEGKALQKANKLDSALQNILVEAGRKNSVYTDSSVKSNLLALSQQEASRFVSDNFSNSDYDYLKPYNSLKDLSKDLTK